MSPATPAGEPTAGAQAAGPFAAPLKDAKNIDELKALDIIISCQGGDYTTEVFPSRCARA